MKTQLTIVLSSTSPSRKAALSTLRIPFKTFSPNIDETPKPLETAKKLVLRLSAEKAKASKSAFPNAFIIGADQIGILETHDDSPPLFFGKPLSYERAFSQLKKASGRTLIFYHGISLYHSKTGQCHSHVEKTWVKIRPLTDRMIDFYLKTEQPYHCAGSIKAESLGQILIEKIQGDDPKALSHLPIIQLIDLFKKENIDWLTPEFWSFYKTEPHALTQTRSNT